MTAALSEAPLFPPRLSGERVPAGQDPMAKGVARAALGTDPGLVLWSEETATARAAIVLAPEVPLERAATAAFAFALGLGDAIGALAPPEVAVHFDWPGGLRVNGARCGRLRAAASTEDPAAEPDWMVVGIEVGLLPPEGRAPGIDAERTWLAEEGCAEIGAARLIEAWARHGLVWLTDWEDRGFGPLHEAWCARAWGIGEPLEGGGVFLGLDESGGQLLRSAAGTEARPLARWLMEAP